MTDPAGHSRRDLIAAAGGLSMLAALPGAAADRAAAHGAAAEHAAAPPTPLAFRAVEALPLPFDPARLPGLSERLLRSHYDNNYMGSLKALAVVNRRLGELLATEDTPPYVYNALKREHLTRTNSVVLHDLYFANLGGGGQADAKARTAIAADFGTFDTWETEFRLLGAGLAGGSGWVVLGYNLHTRRLENYTLADHAHGANACVPNLVMDMYEHAYQMDYGAAAAKYIDAFFANIRWEAVAAR